MLIGRLACPSAPQLKGNSGAAKQHKAAVVGRDELFGAGRRYQKHKPALITTSQNYVNLEAATYVNVSKRRSLVTT